MGINGIVVGPSEPGRVCVETEDGTVLDVGPVQSREGRLRCARLLCEVGAHQFASCPICGRRDLTGEHVPTRAVGGKERTRTCGRCNDRLGSLVEADLDAWYDDDLVMVRFNHDAVRGSRRASQTRLGETRDGKFAVLVYGGDAAIKEMLDAGGTVSMQFSLPDPKRIRVALLKHAYLAACLHLREIPEGSVADAVRAELLAVRDTRDRRALPPTPLADGLAFARADDRSTTGLYLAWATEEGGLGSLALVLGGILVSWPIAEAVVVNRALQLAGATGGPRVDDAV